MRGSASSAPCPVLHLIDTGAPAPRSGHRAGTRFAAEFSASVLSTTTSIGVPVTNHLTAGRRSSLSLYAAYVTLVGSLVLLPAAPTPGQVAAQETDPAVTQLRDFYAVLLQTMKDADRLKLKGRYDKLAPAVEGTFDLPAMTRIAVGPAWTTIPAPEQAQLIEQFSRMTIANYASRFSGYSGERFEVDPKTAERNGNRVVQSQLILAKGDPVTLNYLFHSTPQNWKAIDVYLSGTISELATRRSEFGALLKAKGAGALIESLKQRTDKLMSG